MLCNVPSQKNPLGGPGKNEFEHFALCGCEVHILSKERGGKKVKSYYDCLFILLPEGSAEGQLPEAGQSEESGLIESRALKGQEIGWPVFL